MARGPPAEPEHRPSRQGGQQADNHLMHSEVRRGMHCSVSSGAARAETRTRWAAFTFVERATFNGRAAALKQVRLLQAYVLAIGDEPPPPPGPPPWPPPEDEPASSVDMEPPIELVPVYAAADCWADMRFTCEVNAYERYI